MEKRISRSNIFGKEEKKLYNLNIRILKITMSQPLRTIASRPGEPARLWHFLKSARRGEGVCSE